MGPGEVRRFCPVDETSTNLLKAAMTQIQPSVRAYYHILKLARTIADLCPVRVFGRGGADPDGAYCRGDSV